MCTPPSGDLDEPYCPDDPSINMELYLRHSGKTVRTYLCSNIPPFLPALRHFITMKPISDNTTRNVEALLKQGLSSQDIAKRLGISISSVHRIRRTRLADLPRAKAGRPKKLSEQDRRACVHLITRGGAETAVEVAKQLGKNVGKEISRRTVARALEQSGMRCVEKQRKPRLSPKNVKARLKFAHDHQDWTEADWERVIWSGERDQN